MQRGHLPQRRGVRQAPGKHGVRLGPDAGQHIGMAHQLVQDEPERVGHGVEPRDEGPERGGQQALVIQGVSFLIPNLEEIVFLQMDGDLSMDEMNLAIEYNMAAAKEIHALMVDALRARFDGGEA